MTDQTVPDTAPAGARPTIGASLSLVGAVLVLIAYPLSWWKVTDGGDAQVTGFGQLRGADAQFYEFTAGYLHWAALAGAIVLLVVGLVGLLGRFTDVWARVTGVGAALVAVGAVFAYVTAEGLTVTTGVFLVTAGAVIALAGTGLLMVRR